jgi:hypothetical protein
MSDIRPPQSGAQAQTGTQAQAATPQVPQQTRGQGQGQRAAAPTGGEQVTGWTGWVVFGALMLITVGAFQAVMGLTGLFKDTYFVVPRSDLVVSVSYTAWGWAHLVLGLVAIGAGAGLLRGQMWARILGVAAALVSAVVNMVFMPAYPLWSLTIMTVDILVAFAIIAHGGELKATRRQY